MVRPACLTLNIIINKWGSSLLLCSSITAIWKEDYSVLPGLLRTPEVPSFKKSSEFTRAVRKLRVAPAVHRVLFPTQGLAGEGGVLPALPCLFSPLLQTDGAGS